MSAMTPNGRGEGKGHTPRANHVVVTVHGIRTFGDWQERLERIVGDVDADGHQVRFYHYKYGYLSLFAFGFPFMRWIVTRRFREHLLSLVRAERPHTLDIVAHSFGTHLVAWALASVPIPQRPRVRVLILAGSVLKRTFDWSLLSATTDYVINDCGSRDFVLILNQLFILGTGAAGLLGFHGMTSTRFRNRFFHFGHGGYFRTAGQDDDRFMIAHWVPHLVSGAPVRPVDQRRPSTFEGMLAFFINNADPIKLSVYLTPVVIVLAFTVRQRDTAVARLMSAEAFRLSGSEYTRALLVAAEAASVEAEDTTRDTLFSLLTLSSPLVSVGAEPNPYHALARGQLSGVMEDVNRIEITPDGHWGVAGSVLGRIELVQFDRDGPQSRAVFNVAQMVDMTDLLGPIAITPDAKLVFFYTYGDDVVYAIDVEKRTVAFSIPSGASVTAIGATNDIVFTLQYSGILSCWRFNAAGAFAKCGGLRVAVPEAPPVTVAGPTPPTGYMELAISPRADCIGIGSLNAPPVLVRADWTGDVPRYTAVQYDVRSSDLMAFSGDGRYFAVGGQQTAELYDCHASDGRPVALIAPVPPSSEFTYMRGEGDVIITADDDGHGARWRPTPQPRVGLPMQRTASPDSISYVYVADDKSVVGFSDHGVDVWDIAEGTVGGLRTPLIPAGPPLASHYFDDFAQYVTGTSKLVASHTGRSTQVFTDHLPRTGIHDYYAAMTPGGETLLIGATDLKTNRGMLEICSVGSPTCRTVLAESEGTAVTSVGSSLDGRSMVAGTASGEVLRIDLVTGAAKRFPAGRSVPVTAIGTDRQGQTVTVDAEGLLQGWLPDLKAVFYRTTVTSGGAATSVAMARNNRVAVVYQTGEVALWDISSGRRVATLLSADGDRHRNVSVSPSGRFLATPIRSGFIAVYDLEEPVDRLLDLACEVASRTLTVSEWQASMPARPYRATCEAVNGTATDVTKKRWIYRKPSGWQEIRSLSFLPPLVFGPWHYLTELWTRS
jgi:WD40 repeat protein